MKKLSKYLALIYLGGFAVLFINRSIYAVAGIFSKILFGVSIILWVFPVIALFSIPAIKEKMNAKVKKHLLIIFILGLVSIITYVIQSPLVIGQMLIDPQYTGNKALLEKFKTLCKILYLLTIAAVVVYIGILQTGIQAVSQDGRRMSFIQQASLNLLLLLTLLVCVNYAAGLRPGIIDLTTLGKFTLSPEGRKMIASIDKKVHIIGFYELFAKSSREVNRQDIRYILQDIENTNSNITFEIFDAVRERDQAKDLGANNGVIFVEYIDETEIGNMAERTRRRRISVTTSDDLQKMERGLITAILGVTQTGKKIYFSVGHDELGDVGDTRVTSVSKFYKELKQQGYKIDFLTPENGYPESIPKDATAIAIIGPGRVFAKREISAINQYINNGGRVLLALDPDLKPNFNELFNQFDFEFKQEKVLSAAHLKNMPETVVTYQYNAHPIVDDIRVKTQNEQRIAFWPGIGHFKKTELLKKMNADFEPNFFVKTNTRSWVDKIRNNNQDKNEPSAQHYIGVALSKKQLPKLTQNEGKKIEAKKSVVNDQMRLVAFSDVGFLTNLYFESFNNGLIAVNAMKWLVQDESKLGILPVKKKEKRITLTSGQDTLTLFTLSLIWPLLVFSSGTTYVFLRRKRRKSSTSNEGLKEN